MDKDESYLLSVQKAAAFLGVSVATIRQWAQTNKLRGVKIGSRGDWRFTAEDLSKMIQFEKKKFSKIKKFINKNAFDIQKSATQKHIEQLGVDNTRQKFLRTFQSSHTRIVKKFAIYLNNIKKGQAVFEKMGENLAASTFKKGLTLEEAVDGTIFLKQAFFEKLKEEGLLYELTTKDLYVFSQTIGSYSDILAAKIAFTYHNYYREQEKKSEKERLVIEDKIHKTELKYRLIVDAANEFAIMMLDKEGTILSWGRGAESVFGYSETEVIGKNFSIFYSPEQQKNKLPQKRLKEVLKKGKSPTELWLFRKNGTQFWASGMISAQFDENHSPLWLVEVVRDATEKFEMDRQKDTFIGIASHELKTPITTISAYAQILEQRLEQKNDKKDTHILKGIKVQAHRLNNLIDDLLNVSKMDSGKFVLDRKQLHLDKLIQRVIANFQDTTDTHSIKKVGNTKAIVIGDENRLEQVVVNLITNAIKYSPKGKQIIVGTIIQAEHVIVSIQDFGFGIMHREKVRIFERFYRTQNKEQGNISGFGLGLYIASQILKQHHGRIWVESEVGKGSTFYFSLPFKK